MKSRLFDKQRKGQLSGITAVLGAIIGISIFITIGIIGLALMGDVVSDFHADEIGAAGCNTTSSASCGWVFNATDSGMDGIDNFSGNLTTVGTIIGAVLLIGLVVVGLGAFVATRLR